MLGWSINLFRVRGIQLSLHYSFLLLLAFFGYEGFQAEGLPGLCWAVGLLVGVFTCVVLHELGHSLTARRLGIRVRRILLMPIGGMAEFETIPREPWQELLITIAGPAVNFAIAGLLSIVLLRLAKPAVDIDLPSTTAEFIWALRKANLVLGCFNLIPVFPMDGGRILRALLAMVLPYVRATFWAATIGKILAVLGAGVAFWLAHASPDADQAVQCSLIGILFIFIFAMGELEYRALRSREREEAYWEEIRTRLAAAIPASTESSEEPPFSRN
jgi:Zn-dependent protease